MLVVKIVVTLILVGIVFINISPTNAVPTWHRRNDKEKYNHSNNIEKYDKFGNNPKGAPAKEVRSEQARSKDGGLRWLFQAHLT